MQTSTTTAPNRVQEPAPPRDPRPGPVGGGGPPGPAVVVGVDGGECALAAVRWAAEEATGRGAPLRIVHAAPYLRRAEPGTVSPALRRARRITAAAYTQARHAAPAVAAATEVVPGDPARVLVDAAGRAQLVVLGIATTGAYDELVLAPVAQRVAARSRTPVVVVPRSRGAVPHGRPVAAILGLGDPDDDEPVLRWAADEARRTEAPLTVLRPRARRAAGAEPAVDWAARVPDLDVTVQDVPGVDPRELLRAVCPAPVVVLGAGHGSFLHRLLDGPHRYLLRHCTSPMALIPPLHRPEDEPREEIVAVG